MKFQEKLLLRFLDLYSFFMNVHTKTNSGFLVTKGPEFFRVHMKKGSIIGNKVLINCN